jgi:hypothetical protein
MATSTEQTFKKKIENATNPDRMREKFREHLRSHTGTSAYRKRGPLLYTDGMKDLADQAEGHWLLTMIKSYVPAICKQMKETGLGKHTARLTVEGHEGQFSLFDRWLPDTDLIFGGSPNVDPYRTQEIPHTDFPLPKVKIVIGPAADRPVIESVDDITGIIASLPSES